jgi:hypothetical protein
VSSIAAESRKLSKAPSFLGTPMDAAAVAGYAKADFSHSSALGPPDETSALAILGAVEPMMTATPYVSKSGL